MAKSAPVRGALFLVEGLMPEADAVGAFREGGDLVTEDAHIHARIQHQVYRGLAGAQLHGHIFNHRWAGDGTANVSLINSFL